MSSRRCNNAFHLQERRPGCRRKHDVGGSAARGAVGRRRSQPWLAKTRGPRRQRGWPTSFCCSPMGRTPWGYLRSPVPSASPSRSKESGPSVNNKRMSATRVAVSVPLFSPATVGSFACRLRRAQHFHQRRASCRNRIAVPVGGTHYCRRTRTFTRRGRAEMRCYISRASCY